MYIVTPKQMKAAEEMTDKSGVSYLELMENAGAAAAAGAASSYSFTSMASPCSTSTSYTRLLRVTLYFICP